MTKNPLLNALAAALYVSAIASGIFITGRMADEPQEPTLLIPMGMLMLFVLSTAVMAYVICLQPVRLLIEGKFEEGSRLFIKTIAYLALITAIVFGAMYSSI